MEGGWHGWLVGWEAVEEDQQSLLLRSFATKAASLPPRRHRHLLCLPFPSPCLPKGPCARAAPLIAHPATRCCLAPILLPTRCTHPLTHLHRGVSRQQCGQAVIHRSADLGLLRGGRRGLVGCSVHGCKHSMSCGV